MSKNTKTSTDEDLKRQQAERQAAENVVLRAIEEEGYFWPEPQGDPGRLSK